MSRGRPYAALLALTCGLGYAIRFASLGLPRAVSKYGGSALWAIAIYWLIALLLPRRTVALRALVALLVATAIEFLKLVRTPALDAFRLTLAGRLLLGRFFSSRDILAYAVAIAFAAAFDRALVKPARHVRSLSAVR